MKTFSIILAALAVIAAASADSNAICNGQVGNHAIEERGSTYIACTENTNGEILAEILTCEHADHIWCPHTEHCCLPVECVVIPGHHGDITVKINNKVSGGCPGGCGDDDSSSSSSSESGSSSSSEEDHECRHGHHLQWFEHCEKNGCFGKCVKDQHDTLDIGASSCHHHDNDYLACCRFGTCVADTIGHSTCREEGKDCPTGTTCCGKGCEPNPPTGPCPENEHPVQDPTTCTKFCCEPKPFGLFGGAVRGQVQTDCTSCGHNKFWCNHKSACVDSNTDHYECQLERHERCNCVRNPHPTDCTKFHWKCEDSDHLEEGSCGHEELFHNGMCINHDHPDWHKAKGECICGPGFEPHAAEHECAKTNCCPQHTTIFGVDQKTCRPGPSCDAEHEFWSTTDQICKKIVDHVAEFHIRCRCHQEHHPTDCKKFLWVCSDSDHIEEGTCEEDQLFHNGMCINHDHPDWHKAEGECICGPGFEPHAAEGACAAINCCPQHTNIFGVDMKTCHPGPSCDAEHEFWSVTDRICKKIADHITEFHIRCRCHMKPHPTECKKFLWVCYDSDHIEEGTCEDDQLFHKDMCINHDHPDWHKAEGECICGPGYEPHAAEHECAKTNCCPLHTAIFGADLKTCRPGPSCDAEHEFWSVTDRICKKIADHIIEFHTRCRCHQTSHPTDCKKFLWVCYDSDHVEEGTCEHDQLFHNGMCINHDHPDWHKAKGECVCGVGFEPHTVHEKCDEINCCPHVHDNAIFGVDLTTCHPGPSCDYNTEFWSQKDWMCKKIVEFPEEYSERCCSNHDSGECRKYNRKCDKKPDQHLDCPANTYWWETVCIGPENLHYGKAQSKCLCEHLEGKFPESAGACDTYNCCYPASHPFDILGVQPSTGSGTECENRNCPLPGHFFCPKRGKCVPVSEQNKEDCKDDFLKYCCHVDTAHCHGYKLRCKGDTLPRLTPCECGEFFCYNRGAEGQCGLPEPNNPCYTRCNCEDDDDYYNNGNRICCFKKAVMTPSDFWKNFVPSTECTSIKPECDDCEKWGWVSCGNRLCAEKASDCPHNPESDLLFSKLCTECVYDSETKLCKTPIWTGTEEHPVQKCSWVGDCERNEATGKFEYVLGSLTECHHTGPPTGHGCLACTMQELINLGYTGKNNPGCVNEKSFPGKEDEYHMTCCKS